MKRLHLIIYYLGVALLMLQFHACIEPPLNLPGQQLLTEMPAVETELSVVWKIDVDWKTDWHYGWDEKDDSIWGSYGYAHPSSYQVRRYFTGDNPNAAHTNVDAFSIGGTSFRRYFSFGYYDILMWSNIDSPDGTQVLVINEELESVTATTTGTRGLSRNVTTLLGSDEVVDSTAVVGLKNQPEIFFASYPEDIYISRDLKDYIYNEEENLYIKRIDTELRPLVYIYLVQIVLRNNDGRVKGINGNAAVTSMASGTDLYTGHTNNHPSVIYFNTRLKHNKEYNGEIVDIIGSKFTTFGLCDMEPYTRSGSIYSGTRGNLRNNLIFDLVFANGGVKSYSVDVTDQFQTQAHGGVVTVLIDCSQLTPPDDPESGAGSLFVPTVEDYQEVFWEIEF